MVFAHLTLLSIWIWLWLVFFGWGTLASRLGRCERYDALALVVNPWIGVAVVLGLLQLWHFGVAVNAWSFAITSAIGISSALLLGRRPLVEIAAVVGANRNAFVAGALAVAWLANRSLSSQEYHDHGMYYLNAIRWNTDYAIVPGLANLHARLGFNNSNFLLHALVELGAWRGYSAHIVNGLLAAMTIPIIVPGVRDALYGRGGPRQLGWFTVGVGMIVAVSAVDRRISSANPEFPAGLMASVAAWRFLAIALLPGESGGRVLRWNLMAIAVLATAAVTMKTNVIFFAGLAVAALVASLYSIERRRSAQPQRSTAKLLAFTAAWALFLFGPWVVRGYVLSGYPLFPGTFAGAPVDWRYPPELATTLREEIYAFARAQFDDDRAAYQENWSWVLRWLTRVMLIRAPLEVIAAAAIVVVCLGRCAWSRSADEPDDLNRSGNHVAPWLLAVGYVGGLVAWFLTAPAARMATFAWWGLAGVLLGLASQTIPNAVFERLRRTIFAAILVLFFLPILEQAAWIELWVRTVDTYRPEYGHHFYEYVPLVLRWDSPAFPALRVGKLEARTNDHGLTTYVSIPQADGWPSLPWDSPLPAARYFNPHLTLRAPGDLQSGFRMVPPQTGGAWPPGKP